MCIRDKVFYEALKYYNGDGESAEYWMATPNILLGGECPDEIIKQGAGNKLLESLLEFSQKKGVKCPTCGGYGKTQEDDGEFYSCGECKGVGHIHEKPEQDTEGTE